MSRKKILRIGIASREAIQRRTLDIVAGKAKPGRHDPQVWFTSYDAFARVLNKRNMLLIEVIRNAKPASISELAELTKRETSNVHRTLTTMEERGFVRLERGKGGRVRPVVDYDEVRTEHALAM